MKKILILLFLFVSINGFSQSQNYFDIAYQSQLAGEYEKALENYDLYLKYNPKVNYAYFNRALIKYIIYGVDSCIGDFETAKKLDYPNAATMLASIDKYGMLMSEDYRDQIYKLKNLKKKNNYQPVYTKADSLRGALRFERNCFDVKYYDLHISLDSSETIKGMNKIFFEVVNDTKVIQIDLVKNLKLTKIVYKDLKLKFKREANAIFVFFPEELSKNSLQEISVYYHGNPKEAINPPWEGGFIRKKDKNKNLWMGVACERLGASSWWPNKDHLSDEPDSMRVALSVPKAYKAISNGNLVLEKSSSLTTHEYVWEIKNPINNYNVTFYVGDFVNFKDTLVSINGETQLLDYYVLPYNLAKAKKYFRQTIEVLKFYEQAFGEYPFWNDGFGMVESPYAGMEHQGAIAYGSDYGLQNQFRYRKKIYDYIIVHEAAHEWWGNSLTVADMADAWIHEGFATYAECMFLENKFGYEEYLFHLCDLRKEILNWFPIVGNKNVNDNSFVGGDIYHKGAQVLHNLRCSINNDSLFFDLVKTFAVKYKKSIVSSDDFVKHVNVVTGKDYTVFFKVWLNQNTIPILEYSLSKVNDKIILKYKWTNVDPGFEMPFGTIIDGKGYRYWSGSDEWKTEEFPNNTIVNIPSQWHPDYRQLPRNSFTYFKVKRIIN